MPELVAYCSIVIYLYEKPFSDGLDIGQKQDMKRFVQGLRDLTFFTCDWMFPAGYIPSS